MIDRDRFVFVPALGFIMIVTASSSAAVVSDTPSCSSVRDHKPNQPEDDGDVDGKGKKVPGQVKDHSPIVPPS